MITAAAFITDLLPRLAFPLALLDRDGRIIAANPSWEEACQGLGLATAGKSSLPALLSSLPLLSPDEAKTLTATITAFSAGTDQEFSSILPQPLHPARLRLSLLTADPERLLCAELHLPVAAQEGVTLLRRQQEIIEQLLRLSFTETTLSEQLDEALDRIVKIPWLPLKDNKGAIFLMDRFQPEAITLWVQKGMPATLQQQCATVGFGQCLCGAAAKAGKFLFSSHHPGCGPGEDSLCMTNEEDHSHYLIPISHGSQLLGLLMLYAEAGHVPGAEEQQFLETVASTLALLIERHQAAARLRNSEANLTKAQQIAQLGYWEWRISENTLVWSDEVYRIFGLAPTAIPSTYENFLSHVHPADRTRLEAAVQQSLTAKTPYSIDHRLIRHDGALRVVHEQGEVEYGSNGKPLRMFGTVQDITLLKRSEQQLTLAARVFESSIEGITITDANGIIQSVNRAFTQITGYSPEEAVGQRPSILKSDRHDQAFYQAMWRSITEKGRWEGEIWNRKKNGEVYPEWLTITAISDDFGQVSHHVAVFHDMSEVRSIEEQLRFHTHHDPLTSLPNRTLLLDRLGVAVSHAQSNGGLVAVMAIDLDNFKHVNDSLGHTVGDILLQQVASRLKECVAPDTTVVRLGGDDFAVLMEQTANEQEVVRVAQAILAAFAAPFNLAVYETVVTVSIGISFFPADGHDADSLLKNAELAMYRAKEQGKNTYQLFTQAMNAQVVHRLSLENSLRKALERSEFLVYHQPKVSLATGRVAGMEALVRWRTTDGRLISPLDFIPLAEETGLIVPIGEQVLRQACQDAKAWLRDHDARLGLSVNLSPRQFMQENLLSSITSILDETGFPAERLELEITESAVMANEKAAIALLLELKKLGVRLALDDFGTGYSSLHYLRKLPFDTIKMDRSFVKDLPEEPNSVAIATTILTLAHSLGMEVVAEGVETVEQLEFLRQRNCNEIQGYLFSPPIPAEEFGAMLQKGRSL